MKEKIKIFKALADESRLSILKMISKGEMCNCEMMDMLDLSQPTISHHLKILQDANIVVARKEGKWVHYSLNKDEIIGLIEDLQELLAFEDINKITCNCK